MHVFIHRAIALRKPDTDMRPIYSRLSVSPRLNLSDSRRRQRPIVFLSAFNRAALFSHAYGARGFYIALAADKTILHTSPVPYTTGCTRKNFIKISREIASLTMRDTGSCLKSIMYVPSDPESIRCLPKLDGLAGHFISESACAARGERGESHCRSNSLVVALPLSLSFSLFM